MKEKTQHIVLSIANSYSQIFFSNSNWLALLVFIASFVDWYIGLSGLLCVASSLLFAKWMGFNPTLIRNGTYSYNSLLVGLAMGSFFQMNLAFFVMLFLASFFTLTLTVWLSSVSAVYKIPFLSLPFILGVWIVLLSVRSFGALQLSERGIYSYNELWTIGGATLVSLYETVNSWKFPILILVYLKSLGALFFQYNIISGFLIAIGLLVYSRIAFSLSIIGFVTGYLFCYFVQGNLSELEYSYIGFNYILSAIAIGGFFLIPSPRSYLLALLSAPLVGIMISALGKITGMYGLPLYSLPFTLVVILMLFALNNRYYIKNLFLAEYQQYSPEKNLYAYHNHMERFKNNTYFHIHLPFYGEWYVSQAHEGTITHKADWRYAWDFVVTDETKKTFRLPGKEVTDFYCYALPILAPAAGYVVNLIDGIEDNAIGNVDMENNWGNTIVIKHGEYIFSKISHVKQGSFKVKLGDYVKKGEVIATCGNSGRSPEPHIHFQVQATPYVGAKTLKYPIAYYVAKGEEGYSFHSFDYPEMGQQIFRTAPTPLLSKAFDFVPGMTLQYMVTDEMNKTSTVNWEVFTDANNQSYIYCKETKSVAYFTNNETLFYFTNFKGDYNSILYYFFLGAHKVLLSYFHELKITDALPINGFYKGISKILHDFVAPFVLLLKADYRATFTETDNIQNPMKIVIATEAIAKAGSREKRRITYELEVTGNRIYKMIIKENNKCITAIYSE